MNTAAQLPPLVDAATLRAAGRQPPAPFRLALAPASGPQASELWMQRLLRVLPGKRIVGEARIAGGELDGRRVLAKVFVDAGSARHSQREHEGIAALAAAGIPTPPALGALALPGGGHALFIEFLDGADTLLDAWRALADGTPGAAKALALLTPAFALLGRVHAAGLSHDDLHFGNFLRHEGQLHLIDGDAVRRHASPLEESTAARDLAMLIAQLPRTWDEDLAPLLAAYRASNAAAPGEQALASALVAERAWRLRDYLSKAGRDCSLFKVEKRFRRFTAVWRAAAEQLEPLLADPDRRMEGGRLLKRGNTCTVAQVNIDGRPVVVKRYNLKSLRHALSRLWRPSRGWHSWREGHRLRLFGIPTPAPLALVEERHGPLRGRAWLVNEFCAGVDLLSHLRPTSAPPAAEAAALRTLFATLHRERISHGDLKATNLLWDGRDIQLIDLDAMRQHRKPATYARAWRRDRQRLLRNWPADSELYRWLDTNLPPAA